MLLLQATSVPLCPSSASFFGFMGVTAALVFCNLGASYGTAKSSVGIVSMGIMHPTEVRTRIQASQLPFLARAPPPPTHNPPFALSFPFALHALPLMDLKTLRHPCALSSFIWSADRGCALYTQVMKNIVPVIMAGILGIYGLIVAAILVGKSASIQRRAPQPRDACLAPLFFLFFLCERRGTLSLSHTRLTCLPPPPRFFLCRQSLLPTPPRLPSTRTPPSLALRTLPRAWRAACPPLRLGWRLGW